MSTNQSSWNYYSRACYNCSSGVYSYNAPQNFVVSKSVWNGDIYVLDLSLLKQYLNKYDVIVHYNTLSKWSATFGSGKNGYCVFTLADDTFDYIFNDVKTFNTTTHNNNFYYTNNVFILNQEWFKGAWSNGKYFVGLHSWDSSTAAPSAQNNFTNITFMFYLTKKGLINELL